MEEKTTAPDGAWLVQGLTCHGPRFLLPHPNSYSTSLDLQVEGDGQRWSARSGWCQETWRGLRAVSTASKSCVQTGCCSIPIGQRLHPRPPVQRRTPLLMVCAPEFPLFRHKGRARVTTSKMLNIETTICPSRVRGCG